MIDPAERARRGRDAEQAAARLLEGRGLRVIARNYRIRGGEVDLIARDGTVVVFVEVRMRSSLRFGGPAASIDAAKRARIVRAAQHWLLRVGTPPCRFDAVLISPAGIEWVRDAFSV